MQPGCNKKQGKNLKKIILSCLSCACLLSADTEITTGYGKKDYNNSKTKIDGKTYFFDVSNKISDSMITLGYSKDNVNRVHPVNRTPIESLKVKKYNLKYDYSLTQSLNLKANYIKIIDNLAPTDQGKIYGLGLKYKLPKGFSTAFDYYKSDYEQFNVNQFDASLSKGFKIDRLKLKASVIAKAIKIDGDYYGNYRFKDKNYFTTGVNLSANYNGYLASAGAFFGERMFTVMKDGQKVQHHAMEQDKTYMLTLGKKFQNFDIMANYTYQNGDELPENKKDVDQKITSLILKYRF